MIDPVATDDRKLRILHVLRAPLGGLWRHVVDLAREQVKQGHSVGLVADSLTGGEAATATLRSLESILDLGVKRMPMLRQPHVQDVAAICKVEAHVRRLGVDVIHGHGSKGGLYARLPAYVGGRRLTRCYTPHGGSFNHDAGPIAQSVYMGVEKLLAARTDVLLFESVFIANRFHLRIGDTRALVRIVQNGISAKEFVPVEPNADAADFLYVGELRSAKGIDTLIDAMSLLCRRLSRPIRIILVGTGPDKKKLEEHARLRGVADLVTFPGAYPARQAFTLGRTLVVPSRAESLPYIVLEAAGAQIPMVATDVGGIGEIFGPYRDRLIPCDNPILLAQAMERMMELDAATVRQQAEDLAAFVASRFSISSMADAVIAGYHDAMSRRAAPADDSKRRFILPSWRHL